mmetsp:Transcript_42211/g.30385  ORF Transcript_42211/g.30385 Transcript_42211/m.30385 type:complete len:134 (-) Transcript_42211:297-698(-)
MGGSQSNNMNVGIFGLDNAGKTTLLYNSLSQQDSLIADEKLQPTRGFNCEFIVGLRESFNCWDFTGDPLLREFWNQFLNNIPFELIIYVVNCNESVERLKESKKTLNWLMQSVALSDSDLVIVFNISQNSPED